MIWYSINLSNGFGINALDIKTLYYQILKYMRVYIGDTMKGDYKTLFGTFKQNTYLNNTIETKDIGFVMMTSLALTVVYYESMNQITIKRGCLKNE